MGHLVEPRAGRDSLAFELHSQSAYADDFWKKALSGALNDLSSDMERESVGEERYRQLQQERQLQEQRELEARIRRQEYENRRQQQELQRLREETTPRRVTRPTMSQPACPTGMIFP
jgi:actin-related protein